MWIELHDTLLDHIKVKRLSRSLQVPSATVRGHVVTLWLNVLRHASDGDLSDWSSADIADYAEWAGDAETFVSALVDAGWLVRSHGHIEVNDWRQYATHIKAVERKAADRERKRLERERKRLSDGPADVTPLSEDVTRTSGDFRADQNQNQNQNRTESEPEPEPEPNQQPLSSKLDVVVSLPAEAERKAPEILEVFEHYRTYHPRAHPRPSSNGPEWRAVKARLAEGYSVDELKRAIDGIHRSPFHCGENDRGTKYQGLKLAMRDGDQVVKLAALAEQHANGPPPVLSPQTQRSVRAAVNWAERGQGGGSGAG